MKPIPPEPVSGVGTGPEVPPLVPGPPAPPDPPLPPEPPPPEPPPPPDPPPPEPAVHVPTGGVMSLASRVNAPLRAIARPLMMFAPVTIVMLVSAMSVP